MADQLNLRDFTYSAVCGCNVTFIAESEYHTSRMDPGPKCQLHTFKHQVTARDALVKAARDALAGFRHTTETVRQYLMSKRYVDTDLYAVADGEYTSGFMPLRQALVEAAIRFGRVSLPVWDCDARNWDSELVTDTDY